MAKLKASMKINFFN